jgi:hypothetical protein
MLGNDLRREHTRRVAIEMQVDVEDASGREREEPVGTPTVFNIALVRERDDDLFVAVGEETLRDPRCRVGVPMPDGAARAWCGHACRSSQAVRPKKAAIAVTNPIEIATMDPPPSNVRRSAASLSDHIAQDERGHTLTAWGASQQGAKDSRDESPQ